MNNNSQTILFVDDEQNVLRSLKRLLYDESWNLFFADSGPKGLEILNQENVDLVVSDVRMPGMDGVAFLKEVKKVYPHIIRIFLSGYADHQAVVTGEGLVPGQELVVKGCKRVEDGLSLQFR